MENEEGDEKAALDSRSMLMMMTTLKLKRVWGWKRSWEGRERQEATQRG